MIIVRVRTHLCLVDCSVRAVSLMTANRVGTTLGVAQTKLSKVLLRLCQFQYKSQVVLAILQIMIYHAIS